MDRPVQSIDAVLDRPDMGSFRWQLYLACGLLMFLEGYDAYIVSNLAPVIARGLDIPIPKMGFIFTAQSAGMALGFYTFSVLADRIGRRRIILAGATIFGLLTLASTWPTTLEGFTAVRFFVFLAMGATWPNIVALTSEFLPGVKRGRLMTWIFIAHGLGASAAGLLGPTFVAWKGWESAFWAGGLVLLAFIPLLMRTLPESCRFLVGRDDGDAQIGRTLRRVDPLLTVPADAQFITTEPKIAGSTVAGLFRQGRAGMSLLLWLAMGSALYVTATLTAWLPTYLHLLGNLPSSTGSRMSAVSAFGAIAGPVLLTLLMKRVGMPFALFLTCLIGFACMMSLSQIPAMPQLGWFLGLTFGLLVIGSQAGLNALVASSYPTAIRSTGIGWAGGIGRITSMVGPGVGGAILAAKWSPSLIAITCTGPLLIAALAMIAFHARGYAKDGG